MKLLSTFQISSPPPHTSGLCTQLHQDEGALWYPFLLTVTGEADNGSVGNLPVLTSLNQIAPQDVSAG